jgi:DNA (cytosine-5)-methyltransferase 1
VNGLAICSGVAGLELGLRIALGIRYRTVCHVEREAYSAAVLVARMADAALDTAPIWDDVTTFDGRPWRDRVDIVTAGFPCQPWSAAGKRRGTADARWIWPDIARVIREVGPHVVFLENVPGLSAGLGHVLGPLAEMGFDAEWDLFQAAEAGAPHRRERLFILAHGHGHGCEGVRCRRLLDGEWPPQRNDVDGRDSGVGHAVGAGLEERRGESGNAGQECAATERTGPSVADAYGPGLRNEPWRRRGTDRSSPANPIDVGTFPPGPNDFDGWRRVVAERPDLAPAVEPELRRLADGMAPRVERLRTAGNGVVPQQAALAFAELWWRIRGGQLVPCLDHPKEGEGSQCRCASVGDDPGPRGVIDTSRCKLHSNEPDHPKEGE